MRAIRRAGGAIAASAACVVLAGCASYQAVGLYPSRNDVLVGTVNADLMAGGSHFTLTGRSTGLTCEGSTNVTSPTMSLTCQGQSGDVFATCSDGTTLTGHWYATSCTTGIGDGVDGSGHKLTFRFGLQGDQVNAQIASDEKVLAKLRARERAAQPPRPSPAPAVAAPGAQAL